MTKPRVSMLRPQRPEKRGTRDVSQHQVEVMSCIQAAVEHARSSHSWVVIVAPTNSTLGEGLRTYGLGILPLDAEIVGTTAFLPDGGRVTLAETAYKPVEGKFDLMFLGFEKGKDPRDEIGLANWRLQASRTITLGSKPGEVIVH